MKRVRLQVRRLGGDGHVRRGWRTSVGRASGSGSERAGVAQPLRRFRSLEAARGAGGVCRRRERDGDVARSELRQEVADGVLRDRADEGPEGRATRKSSCAFRRRVEDGTYLFTVARGNLDLERGQFYVAKVTSVAEGDRASAFRDLRGRRVLPVRRDLLDPRGRRVPRARRVLLVRRVRLARWAQPVRRARLGAVGPAGPVGPQVRPVRWDRRARLERLGAPGAPGLPGAQGPAGPAGPAGRLVGSSATRSSRAIAR